jgi:hypothetical protein
MKTDSAGLPIRADGKVDCRNETANDDHPVADREDMKSCRKVTLRLHEHSSSANDVNITSLTSHG